MINLPAKSTSKGIQKAHVRILPTRQGPKPVIVNPDVHRPIVIQREVPRKSKQDPNNERYPLGTISNPIRLPPKERPEEIKPKPIERFRRVMLVMYKPFMEGHPVARIYYGEQEFPDRQNRSKLGYWYRYYQDHGTHGDTIQTRFDAKTKKFMYFKNLPELRKDLVDWYSAPDHEIFDLSLDEFHKLVKFDRDISGEPFWIMNPGVLKKMRRLS